MQTAYENLSNTYTNACRRTRELPVWGRELLAGTVAGMVGTAISHPIDTVKIRM